jgi:predicted nucleic acid-binding protein
MSRGLLRRLATRADLVVPRFPVPVPVRDPSDEHILALAITGNADYLVTGDDDLLTLAGDPRLPGLQIVTFVAFLGILARQTLGTDDEPSGTQP